MNPDREKTLEQLESAIGYRFRNRELLDEALTHRSYLNEARGAQLRDNQRLEFFGDAVLGFLVSSRLLGLLPSSCEGGLSRMRASIVDEETLSGLAEKMAVGGFLLLGKGEEKTGGRKKKSVLADAFEAIVAAVYLDGGLDEAGRLVDRMFAPLLEGGDVGIGRDFKTRFQELSQAVRGVVPHYAVEGVSGPDHDRLYAVTARIGEEIFGRGTGRNKKEAEQAAAKEGLLRLEREGGGTLT